jgi:acetyl-CoA carboxylase carboxyltransferase component
LSIFFVNNQDFTVFGGSLSGAHAKKICKVNNYVTEEITFYAKAFLILVYLEYEPN